MDFCQFLSAKSLMYISFLVKVQKSRWTNRIVHLEGGANRKAMCDKPKICSSNFNKKSLSPKVSLKGHRMRWTSECRAL